MSSLENLVRSWVRDRGPRPFSEVMEAALYDEADGFYAAHGHAGRRGDFLTSPEVGPLFGAVVARALDAWWGELGRPAELTVVEAGAGPGTLARAVLAARPACLEAGALRYVLVERSDRQREQHGPLVERHAGRVVSQATLPTAPPGSAPVVVLANELLDNLPIDILERTTDGWAELRVALRGDDLVGVLVPVPEATAAEVERLAPDLPVGSRVPWQAAAGDWLRSALALVGGRGRVVVWDYASTTPELGRRPIEEWLRTYRDHAIGGHPLEDLGRQDVTCEVAVDQLAAVRPPTSRRSQAEWLRAHGIDALVEEGRATWQERAHLGDLEAIKARSRITEAEALLDEAGLGAFQVLQWAPN